MEVLKTFLYRLYEFLIELISRKNTERAIPYPCFLFNIKNM